MLVSQRERREITMKAYRLARVVLLAMGVAGLVVGSGVSARAQGAGPDYQKMAGLVGDWTSEGQGVASPFGPQGHSRSRLKASGFQEGSPS